jgi:hypothetical protein
MSSFLRLTIVAACASLPATVVAQDHYSDTFIGFQTDCNGNATPGAFNAAGYKEVSSGLFSPCGLLSVNSGGNFSTQQLWQPLGIPVISEKPPGLEGSVALCGATTLSGGGLTFGNVELVFAPPVNEISFDVLEMANATGLSIDVLDSSGVSVIPTVKPTAVNQQVHFTHTSTTPIAKVVLAYVPSGIDGWFIDSLHFNAWHCGDGEKEGMAGEECDDGNAVDCDGCSTACKTTIDGCKTASGCVADGSTEAGSSGCNVCDLSKRTAGSDEGYTSVASGTACPEDVFCLVNETCDGAGACKGTTNDCDDQLTCTVDVCDEAADTCKHDVGSGCMIGGACHATGDRNPDSPCEACDPGKNGTDWTTLTMGETCGDPSCSAGELTPAPTCSASGECVKPETSESCMGFVCADSVSCVHECKEDDDCLEEFSCKDGACVADVPMGHDCTSDAQCDTGHCADGVCCNTACGSTCETCAAEGSVGTCVDVEVGTDPDNECSGAGVCNGANECVSYETRGNGVCTLPQRPVRGRGLGELALLACAGLTIVQRRRRR